MQTRLDRSSIRHNLDGFQSRWTRRLTKWAEAGEKAIEKKYAQSYWADLFSCFGINAARMDLFEQDARRGSTGGHGYIDLFWPGVVLGEAKSPGIDLEVALEQARDYLINILGDPEKRFDITFPLADITGHVDQLKFLAGYEEVTTVEEKAASLAASKLMADLFVAMVGDDVDENTGDQAPTNPEDEDEQIQLTSMFLTRLLFLLFGDDAGLWEQDLFYRFVLEETTPDNLGSQLGTLFEILDTPENKRRRVPDTMAKFPYVNGAIFAESLPTQFFNPDMRDALINACRFRWSDISPAIFGSLFQLVKSKEARRSDGEHYTSETNILKTLEPLFLNELRNKAHGLISAKTTTVKKLHEFHDYLASLVFCDPACGSGNFLIVAYRELRKLETELIVAIREKTGVTGMSLDATLEQKLTIDQFHGIELNWWPARIAETAMFLVDHQANRELADRIGEAPERLPIKITAHIHHGNALQLDWAELIPATSGMTYIFGNPPFIGHQTKTKDQRNELSQVWGTDYDGYLDYVTGWHAQTMQLLSSRQGEFAFVTTNSIVQGLPVRALFEPLQREGWRIKFAHRTFAWDSEAPGKAAVHCVIVGFTRNRGIKQRLWDYPDVKGKPVEHAVNTGINPYLIDGANILVKKRSTPLSPELVKVHFGTMPLGKFLIVEERDYEEVAADPIAAKYLRPFRMGKELIRGLDRWCLWMADDDFNPSDIAKSPVLKQRVEANRLFRSQSTQGGDAFKYRSTPHLFRPNKHRPRENYVGIPAVVSETRLYYTAAHLTPDVIAGNQLYTALDPDGLLFGLISSSMFITWQRAIGGCLESRLRFANTLVWNTFPASELSEKSRQQIIDAGKKILEVRGLHPERSLADHYNPLAMDPALVKAHDALDKAVDVAMGAPRKLTTEKQRLELLIANYVKLTKAG